MSSEKSKKNKKNIICKGITQNGKDCRKNVLNDTEFCKNHEYMKDYTDEMLKDMEKCSGCKNRYYGLNGKICDKCKNRKKNKKTEDDCESEKSLNKCQAEKCKNKKYGKTDYCQPHEKYIINNPKIKLNDTHKRCTRFNKGCTNFLLYTDQFSRCEKCREYEKERHLKYKKNKECDNEDNKKCDNENNKKEERRNN
jgi:hypothetical protein